MTRRLPSVLPLSMPRATTSFATATRLPLGNPSCHYGRSTQCLEMAEESVGVGFGGHYMSLQFFQSCHSTGTTASKQLLVVQFTKEAGKRSNCKSPKLLLHIHYCSRGHIPVLKKVLAAEFVKAKVKSDINEDVQPGTGAQSTLRKEILQLEKHLKGQQLCVVP